MKLFDTFPLLSHFSLRAYLHVASHPEHALSTGFHFDLHHYTLWLPDDKAEKFIERVKVYTTRGPISLKQTQEVIGSLQHVAVMARDLAPYLSEMVASLYAFENKNSFTKLFVGDKVRSDAKEWVSALSSNFRRSFAASGPPFEVPIYIDASTEWDVGILVGERWAAWRLQLGWEANVRGILWVEAIALELGILAALALGAEGHSVLVHGDNRGVIGSFRRDRSRGRQANSVLKRILKLERTWRVEVRVTYIRSADNLADGPSRGGVPVWLSVGPVSDPRRSPTFPQ